MGSFFAANGRGAAAMALGTLLLSPILARAQQPTSTAAVFAPQRVRTGLFTYQDLEHGKEVGTGKISIQREAAAPGNYRFSAEMRFADGFTGFQTQRWESVVTTSFAPVSAALSFGEAAGSTPVFELAYQEGTVTGYAVTRQKSPPGERRTLRDTVPADTVDQRIDWAAVLASPLASGWQHEFHVYDPGTGVSRVRVEVGAVEQVQVPAGTFAAYRVVYRVQKAGKTETYQVLASQEEPRVMVREEFPNGVVTVLTEMSAGPGSP